MIKKAVLYGFNPPFIGGQNNVLSRQEDIQLVKNDILQLLLTIPGERAYRPNFGTSLRSTVFEQADNTTLTLLRASIIDAINRDMPDVVVDDLTITQVGDSNEVKVVLLCSLVSDPAASIVIDKMITGGTYA